MEMSNIHKVMKSVEEFVQKQTKIMKNLLLGHFPDFFFAKTILSEEFYDF